MGLCIHLSIQNSPEPKGYEVSFRIITSGINEDEMRTVFKTDCQLIQSICSNRKSISIEKQHSEPPFDVCKILQILHLS